MKTEKKYKLVCMAFDGQFITDSEHETLEELEYSLQNLGSKWYFYPWSFAVKGQTVKESYGQFVNMKTGICTISEIFNGKRLKTVSKIFDKLSKKEEAQNVNCNDFESLIIDKFLR